MTTHTLAKGVNEGLRAAMERDPKVVLMGEDIGKLGGVFRVTDGLQKDFGEDRVFDTPLAESGIVGTAIGMAMRGYRPVCEIQFDGFIYPAYDQIVSQLAKLHSRSRGQIQMPVVIRVPFGGGIGAVEHHSESPEAYFAHTAGLKVLAVSNASDAYWGIQEAIASPDPVLFFEPKRRYWEKSDVDTATPPAGTLFSATVARPGRDVTLLCYGPMVKTCLQAAEAAAEEGKELEVVDLRGVSPLDMATVLESVRRTRRAVVVHEAPTSLGLGAELAARLQEELYYEMEAPVLRVGGYDTPYPPSRLEEEYLPDLDRVLFHVDKSLGVLTVSRIREFKLPDLGEGLTEGEILQWMVSVGDTVTLNQPIVEVETAKAAVEVPSPFAGVVTQIHHEAGTTVDVGSPIIEFDTDPSAGPLEGAAGVAAAGAAANPVESAAAKDASAVADHPEVGDLVPPPPREGAVEPGIEGSPAPKAEGALIGEVGKDGRTATLVGPGPRQTVAKRRARTGPAPSRPEPAPEPRRVAAGQVGAAAERKVGRAEGAVSVLAKPPVRKLARDLGVDLAALHGSGPGGVITRDDVQAAAGSREAAGQQGAAALAGVPAQAEPAPSPAPSYDPATRERRIPVKGVRRLTAQAMVGSAFTAPHVTEFITLDMTPTMELLARVKARPEFAGVKVTPLLFVAKALLLAVRRNPEINSTYTDDEIIVKDYVNLGIAAATPRGLIVPNVKDADALDLLGLARALQELTQTAKEGKTSPADMQGGTITITNVGVFGVDNGTPILNPGESAILCFGAVRPTPWVHEGEIAVRQVTQLSLSFDHRNVDGQLGSQFLADVAAVLSDPVNALLF